MTVKTVTAATLQAIVASLGDDHARRAYGNKRPPDYYEGDQYGLGLRANVSGPQVTTNPRGRPAPAVRHREVIDRVGVAPDHHVPLTPKDAAAGRDPALAKALTLLHK